MYLAQHKSQAEHELEQSTAICGLTLGRGGKITQFDQTHAARELTQISVAEGIWEIATRPGRVEVHGSFFAISMLIASTNIQILLNGPFYNYCA